MDDTPLAAAHAAYQAGDFDGASSHARAFLQSTPAHEAALTLLALSEHAAGRYVSAADAFRQLTAIRPQVPDYWSNLGYMLRLTGRQQEAEAAFLEALRIAPRAYGALLNYGLLLMDMSRFGAARHRFLDAVEADPSQAEARIYAASACFECGDIVRAERLLPPPGEWHALDAEARHDLGMALMRVGRTTEAERLLESGQGDSDDPDVLAKLALLYERTNRLGLAQALFDRLHARLDGIGLESQADALTVGSILAMRRKDYDEARTLTEQLLSLDPAPTARANALYTLAAIADKQSRPDETMRLLAEAHAIHMALAREMMPEISQPGWQPLPVVKERMTPGQALFVDRPHPAGIATPVFIVGFPRSGTTMLENMLDAHPGFVSMDEQPFLDRCVELVKRAGFNYPHQIGEPSDRDMEALRADYWQSVSRVAKVGPGQTLVDKNPLNILRLPLIRRMFPDARIILALRHPCDVILSCYMQDFRSPMFRVLCSNLETLAQGYVDMMRFWIDHQALLQAEVLDLRYEETVGDFDRQVGRIAEFLGIADRHHLAEFSEAARRKGYIGTPSYSQVIEPVNTKAVARWERYRPWFEPVLPILKPIADHWGYSLSLE
ncbi:tetratricopeptide repeat-containing sulfotransferase family protein [Pseudoluteimonas lycopersici]|nr:tetratricopeptide repeat-containing sulfotransferase family protein [Lysobacter lycopersici]